LFAQIPLNDDRAGGRVGNGAPPRRGRASAATAMAFADEYS